MDLLKKQPAMILGVLLTLLFLAAGWFKPGFLESLELKFYDARMQVRKKGVRPEEIIIVDIDEASVKKIGRWPWPRGVIGAVVEKIGAGGPRAVGMNIFYSEPDERISLKELKYLLESGKTQSDDLTNMLAELDNDRKLAQSINTAGDVYLPVYLTESAVRVEVGEPDPGLAAHALKIPAVKGEGALRVPAANDITLPIDPLFQAAAGIGHVNLHFDADGKVRRENLLFEYGGLYFPSLTLRLAAAYLGVPLDQIRVSGKSLTVGGLTLPVTDEGAFLIDFIMGENPFRNDAYSFFDVYTDKIPPEAFKNRVVLIMPSAPGIMNPVSTPSANSSPVGHVLSNSLWAMLNNRSIVQPAWDKWATLGLVLFVGAVIALLLPRLKSLFALIAFILLFAVIVSGAFYLFIGGIWIHTVYPVLQLVIGYIGVVTLSYFATETRKTKMEGESAETNRTLALTYQSQGMLDMAFDKLRKVPVDEGVKEILYSLALDFERKRQLNKAANVYAYIEEQDPTYKDAAQKKRKLLQASDSMVYGNGFLGGQTGDAVLSGGSDTRPTLGRYEIMKQLGKGAMGVVYLGQDPRINRTTAIKTFRFTDDFEPEEAERMKETFFREAESAGTLSHPHIVTIYDAGEEQELAYIAMEYLEGEDLQKYTKQGRLLPMRKVLEVVADVADALAYAHDKGIVHRDIKPANIMLLKNGVVKVTDFGIARVVATSQTQTGVVKGTPHYMSPEQISGEKVDGRSDLFSLGVMLYQLLTGKLPFTGSNPAALMHQIMNVPAPNPKTINPKLSNAHVNIINKAMEKDREKRYQTGAQLATHLRTLLKKIDAMMAAKKAKK